MDAAPSIPVADDARASARRASDRTAGRAGEGRAGDRLLDGTLAAIAALLLGGTLCLSSGHNTPGAIAGLSLTLLVAYLALARPRVPSSSRPGSLRRLVGLLGDGERPLERLLAAGVLAQLTLVALRAPGPRLVDVSPSGRTPGFLLLVGLLALWTLLCASPLLDRLPRALPRLVLALLALLLGAWMIRHAPDPRIDVDVIHRQSAAALLDGRNPYALTFPNIYGSTIMYGPGQATLERLAFGYCYPPLPLLVATLGHAVAGDHRYGELAAIVATGLLLASLRRRDEPQRVPLLAAALLLTTPRGLYVVEHGWTDPVVALGLAFLLFAARRAPSLLGVGLGLFLVAKQYAPLFAPLLLGLLVVPRAPSLRALARTLGVAALVGSALVLPFLLWSPRDFWWSVVALQFRSPFRRDALSLLAFAATTWGLALPALVGFAALLPSTALGLLRAARTEAGAALAVAATSLAFFALNKQAFANYYFFVVAAFAAAVAALAPPVAALAPPVAAVAGSVAAAPAAAAAAPAALDGDAR